MFERLNFGFPNLSRLFSRARDISPSSSHDKSPHPAIWSALPQELCCMVVEHCDRETQINWSCTNSYFHNFASNILWKSVRIVANDLEAAGMTSSRSFRSKQPKVKDKNGKLILFLANQSFRRRSSWKAVKFPLMDGQEAKLPAQWIKYLDIDFRQRDPSLWMYQDRKVISSAVGRAIKSMTQLQFCTFDGAMHPQTLRHLLQKKDLQGLFLRRRSEWLRPATEDWALGGQRVPAFNQILNNLRCLATLPHLRILSIARLVPAEARGLAEAVVSLKLVRLLVSAAPPARDDDGARSLVGSCGDESPLILFLQSVCRLSPVIMLDASLVGGGLPSTLQQLTLRDLYRPTRASNEKLILNTVGSCVQLEGLELRTMASKQLKAFFQHANFPALEMLSVSGCRHFLADKEWIALGLPEEDFELADPVPSGSIGVFRDFLSRHRTKLGNLEISKTAMSIIKSNDCCLGWFPKAKLDRLWSPDQTSSREYDRTDGRNRSNWYAGGWPDECGSREYGFCCDGFCYAIRNPIAISMSYLEGYPD
ncbi:MAG: hypothetical protein Q9170_003045 [Blastenia crenularia]